MTQAEAAVNRQLGRSVRKRTNGADRPVWAAEEKVMGAAPGRPVVDRRVRRTRGRLRWALLELTLERGYGGVTVQDVLERADVARATFYAHYRDKDDLLLSGFDELREQLRGHLRAHEEGERGGGALWGLFEHVGANRSLWQALTGRRGGGGAGTVMRRAREELEGLLREHLEAVLARAGDGTPGGRVPLVPAEVVVSYVVSALAGLLTWWLDDDAAFRAYDAGQLHTHFMRLTEPAIGAVVGAERVGVSHGADQAAGQAVGHTGLAAGWPRS